MNEPPRPRRRSLRAGAFDYATPGAYFFTTVTQGRACMFGSIFEDQFVATPAGEAVSRVWHDLPLRFPVVELDQFIVMPNHVHGLLWLKETHAASPESLGTIIGGFKSLAAREVN